MAGHILAVLAAQDRVGRFLDREAGRGRDLADIGQRVDEAVRWRDRIPGTGLCRAIHRFDRAGKQAARRQHAPNAGEYPSQFAEVDEDVRRQHQFEAWSGVLEVARDVGGREFVVQAQGAGIVQHLLGQVEATDYCVLNTVTDALEEGFDAIVVPEAMRAVDVKPGDGTRALDRMVARGAVPVRLGAFGMTALSVA